MRMLASGIVLCVVAFIASARVAGSPARQGPEAEGFVLPGEFVRAVSVVLAARDADPDLKPSEKNVLNFDVHVGRANTGFRIAFDPRLAQGESRKAGGRTSLGRSELYGVSDDYRVLYKSFMK
jgi:hypothetical protein